MKSIQKPRVVSVDTNVSKTHRMDVVAQVAAALNAYYLTMPPYEPPPVYQNPRA